MTSRDHALAVLEFERALEVVAGRAVSEPGAAALLARRPLDDIDAARRELAAVAELMPLLAGTDPWRLDAFPDLAGSLARLAIPDAILDADALSACADVMRVGRAAGELMPRLDPAGLSGAIVEDAWGDAGLEKRIGRTFDEGGGVADRASPELRRIRRRLVDRRARLVDRLERFARDLPERLRVSDASVTVRNGRYCVPIRREGKGATPGLVHDASASRQTLFVEPTIAIDAMNEIRELEIAETREVRRILEALSNELREVRAELAASFRALVELDSLRARAAYASESDATAPELTDAESSIEICGGRHPLLDAAEAVPFDLTLDPHERVLLISGPNAGGKTVFLKAVGLIVALAKSGVVPPVRTGTRFPFFDELFAVIGDEQSIDASLSTFGAQAKNLAEILTGSGPRDLVLIDEIGSATDPAEGGALAAAALTRLAGRARLTIATTHLGDLKRLGDESRSTVNASLQFDSRLLEPTYRLARDRPGRSYALVIAARLGVPDEVLDDARARLEAEHVSLDELLDRLETERAETEELRARLETRDGALDEAEARVAAREAELEARLRRAAREREHAVNRALKEARATIEETIARLEVEHGADERSRTEARRRARSEVERAIRESTAALTALDAESRDASSAAPRPGDRVRWHDAERSGVLVEVRGRRGIVEVEGLRLTVPLSDLRTHPQTTEAGSRTPPPTPPSDLDVPELTVRTEVDLRGLRVDEVSGVLNPALDAAVVAELPWLRVIHGKGTGALRSIVRDLLRSDGRVPAFRPGERNEGGSGVTVVEFEAKNEG
ncbi:MAG: Smr/MutS family protein [Gemmatimonadetes bacterium]|nr:Smr/MutS family protein [Gemmatimonadota bacterium]